MIHMLSETPTNKFSNCGGYANDCNALQRSLVALALPTLIVTDKKRDAAGEYPSTVCLVYTRVSYT